MNKTSRKKAVFRDKHFTTIVYEYRGREYEVTYPNGWMVCCTPAWVQHRDGQEKIDKLLDNPNPTTETEPMDKQLEEIWEMMGWNE